MNPLLKFVARATDSFREIIAYYLAILAVSAGLFAYFEDKTLLESLWWACVTALTIGYGDLYPVTTAGKLVAVFLMHAVPLFIIPLIVARLLLTVIEDHNQFSHDEQEIIKADIAAIKKALNIEEKKADE